MDSLLNGCTAWSMEAEPYSELRTIYHRLLLRFMGSKKRKRSDNVMSYQSTIARTGCETVPSTVRKRRICLAAHIVGINANRLPRQFMCGHVTGGAGGGGGGKHWKVYLNVDLLKLETEPEGVRSETHRQLCVEKSCRRSGDVHDKVGG